LEIGDRRDARAWSIWSGLQAHTSSGWSST